MSWESLILSYGYPIVLLGTFLEGETILVIAGFMAHRGYLDLPWVMAAACVGSMCGDQLAFHLGRRGGARWLVGRPTWQRRAERVGMLLDRYQTPVVLGFRFLYGLRNVTPFVIGASGYSARRFFLLNAAGAALWSVTVAGGGYLFGRAIESLIDDVRTYEFRLLLLLAGGGALLWLIYQWRARRAASRARRGPGDYNSSK